MSLVLTWLALVLVLRLEDWLALYSVGSFLWFWYMRP